MTGVTYTEEIAVKILDRLAEGESLTKICKEAGMPCRRTVLRWRDKDEYKVGDLIFRDALTMAYEDCAEYYADIINQDALKIEGLLTGERDDNAKIQAIRLKIDALKWTACKLNQRRFGEKQLGTSSDPITVVITSYKDD